MQVGKLTLQISSKDILILTTKVVEDQFLIHGIHREVLI